MVEHDELGHTAIRGVAEGVQVESMWELFTPQCQQDFSPVIFLFNLKHECVGAIGIEEGGLASILVAVSVTR